MQLNITLAQINSHIGDIPYNLNTITQAIISAKKAQSDLIIFPECALTGYPLKDLVLHQRLHETMQSALTHIKSLSQDIAIVIGHPLKTGNQLYNCATFYAQGAIQHTYRKQALITEGCFDEARTFMPGPPDQTLVEYQGYQFGLSICHDLWHKPTQAQLGNTLADCMINLSASPFYQGKRLKRNQILSGFAQQYKKHLIYINTVGAQDALIFDGGSQIITPDGVCAYQAPYFKTSLNTMPMTQKRMAKAPLETLDDLHQALVLGIQDYALKNRIQQLCLGLSGGIDSAVVCCLAIDALGLEQVSTYFMPTEYTSKLSYDCVKAFIKLQPIKCTTCVITPLLNVFKKILNIGPTPKNPSIALQNLQARLRAIILMHHTNTHPALLLSTGNKSELSMGYCTLYGDLSGALSPIADLTKTQVYEFAHHLNTSTERIPTMILERPPTAELAPEQRDCDELPEYALLDPLLETVLKEALGQNPEIQTTHPIKERIERHLQNNAFKLQQTGIMLRVSQTSLGIDRQYPVTYVSPAPRKQGVGKLTDSPSLPDTSGTACLPESNAYDTSQTSLQKGALLDPLNPEKLLKLARSD